MRAGGTAWEASTRTVDDTPLPQQEQIERAQRLGTIGGDRAGDELLFDSSGNSNVVGQSREDFGKRGEGAASRYNAGSRRERQEVWEGGPRHCRDKQVNTTTIIIIVW